MWDNLERPWQECFKLAWDSFKKGSIPIGAVIVNDKLETVSIGRNMINETTSQDKEICRHQLAHAELNALLRISKYQHPSIEQYVLYSTMEPCPMCFGAIIMANIKTIKFAARDGWAGSTNLKNEYIVSRNLMIEGPINQLEDIQVALQTVFELSKHGMNQIIESFRIYSPKGVKLGEYLSQQDILTPLVKNNEEIQVVFNKMNEWLIKI